MELTAFKYAESDLAHDQAFLGGDPGKRIPISFLFYLISMEDHLILADVGCNELPGFDMRHFIKPTDLLMRYGIKTQDITDVFITHSDWDHMGTITEFAHANIYIQQEEYQRERKKYETCSHIYTFDNTYDFCDNIRLVKIGGHQAGSSVVEVKMNQNIYVLGGDECYVNDCLARKIPTGSTHCPEKSRYFVEHYSDEKYTVFLYHDPGILPGRNGAVKI